MGDVFVVSEIEKKIEGLSLDVTKGLNNQNILLRRGYTFPDRVTEKREHYVTVTVPSFTNESADNTSYESSNAYTTIFSTNGPSILKNFKVSYSLNNNTALKKIFFKITLNGAEHSFAIYAEDTFLLLNVEFGDIEGNRDFPFELEKCNDLSMQNGNNAESAEKYWDIGDGLVCENGISISMYCEKGTSTMKLPINVTCLYELYEEV